MTSSWHGRYDAITTLNFVWYQNTLNYMNIQFALAAGSILTNYAWTPELAESGRNYALQNGIGLENVYFGIDVWAQNAQHHSKHKRVTWPKGIGGGTGTGLGVEVLNNLGLNAGIFAPGWSFEHFSQDSASVESAIWEGKPLSQELECECNPDRPHDITPGHGITKYTSSYPAGSSSFFHTNFERAFARDPKGILHAQLNSQSVLPYETESPGTSVPALSTEVRDSPPRCVVSLNPGNTTGNLFTSSIQIAKLMLSTAQPLELTMQYRTLHEYDGNLFLDIICSAGGTLQRHRLDEENGELQLSLAQGLDEYMAGIVLICEDNCGIKEKLDLLEIFRITIQPQLRAKPQCEIHDIRVEARKDHHRVIWNLIFDIGDSRQGLPYSPITGPCAYFDVNLDTRCVGRAYAKEFVLSAEQWSLVAEQVVEVKVVGVGFDDEVVCESATAIAQNDGVIENWVVV